MLMGGGKIIFLAENFVDLMERIIFAPFSAENDSLILFFAGLTIKKRFIVTITLSIGF